jgi:hypothetical protein
LAAGKAGARLVQIVFDLIPKGSHLQRFLQAFIKKLLIADSVQPEANDDIFTYRHRRKRIRFLENHADPAANDGRIDAAGIKIVTLEEDLPFDTRLWHEIMHAIEGANKS